MPEIKAAIAVLLLSFLIALRALLIASLSFPNPSTNTDNDVVWLLLFKKSAASKTQTLPHRASITTKCNE